MSRQKYSTPLSFSMTALVLVMLWTAALGTPTPNPNLVDQPKEDNLKAEDMSKLLNEDESHYETEQQQQELSNDNSNPEIDYTETTIESHNDGNKSVNEVTVKASTSSDKDLRPVVDEIVKNLPDSEEGKLAGLDDDLALHNVAITEHNPDEDSEEKLKTIEAKYEVIKPSVTEEKEVTSQTEDYKPSETFANEIDSAEKNVPSEGETPLSDTSKESEKIVPPLANTSHVVPEMQGDETLKPMEEEKQQLPEETNDTVQREDSETDEKKKEEEEEIQPQPEDYDYGDYTMTELLPFTTPDIPSSIGPVVTFAPEELVDEYATTETMLPNPEDQQEGNENEEIPEGQPDEGSQNREESGEEKDSINDQPEDKNITEVEDKKEDLENPEKEQESGGEASIEEEEKVEPTVTQTTTPIPDLVSSTPTQSSLDQLEQIFDNKVSTVRTEPQIRAENLDQKSNDATLPLATMLNTCICVIFMRLLNQF